MDGASVLLGFVQDTKAKWSFPVEKNNKKNRGFAGVLESVLDSKNAWRDCAGACNAAVGIVPRVEPVAASVGHARFAQRDGRRQRPIGM